MNPTRKAMTVVAVVLFGNALLCGAGETRDAEAAVRAGLRWLAENQVTEGPEAGSWPCEAPPYRTAVASLAGLAFLANGHLPGEEPYGAVAAKAMAYVKASADPDGYLGRGDRSGMYIHAICTLFGLSYFGTSQDAEEERDLADWCRKSIEVIVDAQSVRRPTIAAGGWRYTPYTSESDVSVTSWQLMTLQAGRQCGFEVPPSTIHAGLTYLNNAFVSENGSDSGFMYRPGVSRKPDVAVTGVALFIKSLLEREQDSKAQKALAYLQKSPPSWGGPQYGGYFYFTLFYMTQGMFQVGGHAWDTFATGVHGVLIEHQAGDGRWPFPPDNTPQSRLTGGAYPTAMAVLVLSLEKQYLPLFCRQQSLF